jgi:hypothetical protein
MGQVTQILWGNSPTYLLAVPLPDDSANPWSPVTFTLGFAAMLHRTPLFLTCSSIHFAAAISAFAWSFSASSDAFDGREVSWLGRHIASAAVEVLWFPVPALAQAARSIGYHPSPLTQWLLLLANSALWGLVVALLITRLWPAARRALQQK